jgi:zinc transport system permease protein
MLISALTELFAAFQFQFMQNALIAGVFIAISCAIIGVFLVLHKFSMIGDGLAHVSLATVALGLLIGVSPIFISIPLVMGASLFILKLSQKSNVWGDSAIGFVASVAVALAVLIASVADGFNVDLFSYLFGTILAITQTEVLLSVILSIITISIVILYYHDLFTLTFDSEFARVSGIKVDFLNSLLVMVTAVIVVLGVRVVGTMLVSSLIVIPAITALQVAKGFKSTIIISVASAVFSVVIGISLSYLLDIPSGATIVLVNALLFGLAFIINKMR